jgi:DNA-binding response OmpR family regulator
MTQTGIASIMVVDDQPNNLNLLEDMMANQGYAVRSFPRGRLALASAAQSPPDLILLDINMPEMNGFEVCERLKAEPALASIPVIFLSALNETEDKIRAFRSGGVDYVTKPFELAEVLARVATHLELRRLQRAMEEHGRHLEEVVRARTRELVEAHARLKILDRSKSDFLRLISHEFRTPLNGLLGITELIWENSGSERDSKLRKGFETSRERILSILDHALLLTRIEVEASELVGMRSSLAAVVRAAIEQAARIAAPQRVRLDCGTAGPVFVLGREDLLATALRALLETAVKFSEPGGVVRLTYDSVPDVTQIAIESRGKTVPPLILPKFFDLFAFSEDSTSAGQLGLDPAVAHRILALFGGSVTIENRDPAGIQITVCLKPAPD